MNQKAANSSSKKSLPSRPLLDLQSGDKSRLERAFHALVGAGRPKTDPARADFEAALQKLGFTLTPDQTANHPSSPRTSVSFANWSLKNGPTLAAIAFAAKHFPATEFYLPFILAKAELLRQSPTTSLAPEPDYDDDGFLTDA